MSSAQQDPARADWVAVDWGTSHLRLWVLDAQGAVLWCHASDQGMGRISPDKYEPVLLRLLSPYLSQDRVLDVVCCGMVGSRQGWAEAPYASTPCAPPDSGTATIAPCSDPRLRVMVLPGVKQQSPADVMRGEETQIAGVVAAEAGFSGVVCLPGTHTKWARIVAGEIRSFATCMSGELFNVISHHSVLRHSIGHSGWDAAAFDAACAHAYADPTALMAELFSLRAQALLADLSPEAARASLSGLLLGAELAATRSFWHDASVTIVGASEMAQAYCSGLMARGATAHVADAEEITLRGLKAAYQNVQKG